MSDPSITSEYESFNPSEYLREYYIDIGDENDFLLECAAKAYKDFEDNTLSILEIGGGPTIYQLISSSRPAHEIYFTDYSNNNLEEVKKWLSSDNDGFEWDQFIARGLLHEGLDVGEDSVAERKQLIRDKVTKLSRYDVISNTLLSTGVDTYDLVSSVFSTDAITHSVDQWKSVLGNVTSRVKTGGWLILVGVLGSDNWVMGDETFKATNLSREVVESTLQGLDMSLVSFNITVAEPGNEHGYDGVFYVKAQKK